MTDTHIKATRDLAGHLFYTGKHMEGRVVIVTAALMDALEIKSVTEWEEWVAVRIAKKNAGEAADD